MVPCFLEPQPKMSVHELVVYREVIDDAVFSFWINPLCACLLVQLQLGET